MAFSNSNSRGLHSRARFKPDKINKIGLSGLYTISLIQIQFYTAVYYGVLQRISPATFLQLKIQLQTAKFEPRTFRVPVSRATTLERGTI